MYHHRFKGEGIDGVIKDGENGFLCKAGDVKALTSVLENILSLDKATKTRIISNAIDTAQILTQENVSREYHHNKRAILCNSKGWMNGINPDGEKTKYVRQYIQGCRGIV